MSVSLPLASPPAEMTISALPTGSMSSKALFAFRGGGFGDDRAFTMTAFLVRHPRGDLLFDAGFGRNLPEHALRMPWLMRQLAGYRDVRAAVMPHGPIRPGADDIEVQIGRAFSDYGQNFLQHPARGGIHRAMKMAEGASQVNAGLPES